MANSKLQTFSEIVAISKERSSHFSQIITLENLTSEHTYISCCDISSQGCGVEGFNNLFSNQQVFSPPFSSPPFVFTLRSFLSHLFCHYALTIRNGLPLCRCQLQCVTGNRTFDFHPRSQKGSSSFSAAQSLSLSDLHTCFFVNREV